MDCVFCAIAKGIIPAAKVFENDATLAFLDINPDAKGHTLVISKNHATDLFDIDENTLKEVSAVVKIVASRLKERLGADGINTIQNNAVAAGQIIMHYHVHVIPRFENDGIKILTHQSEEIEKPSPEALRKLAQEIAS